MTVYDGSFYNDILEVKSSRELGALYTPKCYRIFHFFLQAPPLRVCLLGIHGAGKSTCARQIADKLGIFHIQFEEYLQELILPKTKRKVGPSLDEDNEDDYKIPEELEDFSQTITKTEKEKTEQVIIIFYTLIYKITIFNREQEFPIKKCKIIQQ